MNFITNNEELKTKLDKAELKEREAAIEVIDPVPFQKSGLQLIGEERQRQKSAEGFDCTHDSPYLNSELPRAARSYLNAGMHMTIHTSPDCPVVTDVAQQFADLRKPFRDWPWDSAWWKPSDDPVRNLVKAGALIAAEIDRIQMARHLE